MKKRKDPKTGTGKKPKGSGRRLIRMKTQKIQLVLSLLLWLTLEKQ